MKRIIISILLLVLAGVGTYSALQARPIEDESLVPDLAFLGEGPANYTVPPGYNFIIKLTDPFRFDWEPGPTYTATERGERVWRSSGTGNVPPAAYHEDVVVGPMDPGCVIQYAAIDDDVDDRINYFRLDGNIIHELPQGMVSRGEFTINSAGILSYEANDSIGLYLSVCEIQKTPVPTVTSPATATPVVTALPTSLTPTLTATPDGRPDVTPTVTATVTPTPKPPRLRACARINFEVAGDVAQTGTYALQEVGGRTLATWYALDGWESSPWITGLDITFPEVHVQVLYYPTDGSEPTVMRIVNHAPGTPYGWLARGMCHAIEVAWP